MIRIKGEERPWREGMTVSDLFVELNDFYSYAFVLINGSWVPKHDFEKVVIPDEAEIFFVPMITGG